MFTSSAEPEILFDVPVVVAASTQGDPDLVAAVNNFVDSLSKAPEVALASHPPVLRRARTPPSKLPRRSKRIARVAGGRASNATVQAQNVLLKKLGITSTSKPPVASSVSSYLEFFEKPLSESHKVALDELFPRGGLSVPAATAVMGIEP